jgi:hypothetical protein
LAPCPVNTYSRFLGRRSRLGSASSQAEARTPPSSRRMSSGYIDPEARPVRFMMSDPERVARGSFRNVASTFSPCRLSCEDFLSPMIETLHRGRRHVKLQSLPAGKRGARSSIRRDRAKAGRSSFAHLAKGLSGADRPPPRRRYAYGRIRRPRTPENFRAFFLLVDSGLVLRIRLGRRSIAPPENGDCTFAALDGSADIWVSVNSTERKRPWLRAQ